MKSERQNAMIELISRYDIETQEEMISRLADMGYDVTQATVSRDIRELKLTKMLTAHGTYRYVRHQENHHRGHVKLNNAVADSIVSVDYSNNMIVLKTFPGLAMAVASGIDAMNLPDVLGCIGGDDTIMIVTRGEEISADISAKIKDLMKNI